MDNEELLEFTGKIFKFIPICTKNDEIKIGDLRLIPKGTPFWSINNQTEIMTDKDEIVEIKHTCYFTDIVFVKPKKLLFNLPGFIPMVIDRGVDEWDLSYSKTLPYSIPKPQF